VITAAPRQPAAVVDTIVIGGGHCGLAMSQALSQRGIGHAVLERGEAGNAWRTERWDSLRLLTPNWMTRLPGLGYFGRDPKGYMTAAEVAEFLGRYAERIAAPLHSGTTVRRVCAIEGGYRVSTDRGAWHCRTLVLATGASSRAKVPDMAAALPAGMAQFTALNYRRPSQLSLGGVLVVGASATGLQLAQEIQRSGRPVTLAVGEHVRMPRLYRGRDIQWWLLASGVLDQRFDEVDDATRVRHLPSPQLIGTPERVTLDLNTLHSEGVRLAGRLAAVRDGKALFSGSLRNVCALADLKLNRLLDLCDRWAETSGMTGELGPAERFEPTRVDDAPLLSLDLGAEIRTVIWANGLRPDHRWLDLPVFDRHGELKHRGGNVIAPGVYVLGLPFLRRRKSSFIHGADDDVRELADHLAAYLGPDLAARSTPSIRIAASTLNRQESSIA
jgi:putative flavoprotein involved in K+ transport